jgi:hypothetical protein
MAFTSFTCIDEVVKKYKLIFVQRPLLPPDPTAPPLGDYFREELAFNLRMLPIGRSEIGAGEVLLFPIHSKWGIPMIHALGILSLAVTTISKTLTTR